MVEIRKANLCGSRIKQMRLSHGLSQSELAAAMEVDHQIAMNQSEISAIERDERGVKDYEIDAFGKVLSVSLEWLVRG